MGHLGWWSLAIFLGGCIAEGVYLGLKDRFGPNILDGYREYKRQCAFWDSVRRLDGSYGLPTLARRSQHAFDRRLGPDQKS